jgi:hypothetical protein
MNSENITGEAVHQCMNVSFISSIKANPPSGKLSISNMKRKFLGREMCTDDRRLDYKVTFLTIKEFCSEAGLQYIFLRKKTFTLVGKHHITYSHVYNKIVTILSAANVKSRHLCHKKSIYEAILSI